MLFVVPILLLHAAVAYAGARVVRRADVNGDTVPGKWVIELAPTAVLNNGLIQELKNYGVQVDQKASFDLGQLKGFTVKANDTIIDSLSQHDNLLAIQPATVLSISVATRNPLVKQTNGTWGLDRISHRTYSARDFPSNPTTDYKYLPSAGVGTVVYVVDTGVYIAHNDFGGRASNGANFVVGEDFTDLNGHGTHIAGIAGGRTYGVAKRTKLISVKVLNAKGSSDTSIILKALDWIYKDAMTNKRLQRSIVNFSFGGAYDQILNDAVDALQTAGMFVVAASGNRGVDTNTASPASASGACAIGSMTWINSVNAWSNYGPKVAVHAPGFRILSTGISGPNSIAEMSGTSMASPHVAGLGAYLIGTGPTRFSGRNLCATVQQMATQNQLTDESGGTALASGSPNLIAFNGVVSTQK